MPRAGAGELDDLLLSPKIDMGQIDVGQKFRAIFPRALLELARDRAHTADRHLPLARFVADQMIKKTAVLHERRIVRMGEDADLAVGQHKPAHQIVLQITLDSEPERFFGQAAPRFAREIIVVEASRHFLFCDERFEHAVPGTLGKHAREIVKLFHLFELGVASSKIDNRFSARLVVDVAQEQPFMMAVVAVGRE